MKDSNSARSRLSMRDLFALSSGGVGFLLKSKELGLDYDSKGDKAGYSQHTTQSPD